MSLKEENNYAFIDSQNVSFGVRAMGWQLDFAKFRIYLKEKYGVSKAYLFLGYIPWNEKRYETLNEYGYLLIFKKAIINKTGLIKGNVDAELVLQAMIEYENYEKAVIVSGDGDFACLVRHLNENQKLKNVIVPNKNRYSGLLKKAAAGKISFMNDMQIILERPDIKSPS
jgi:uncharacterized LabA/DUF88 family protein